MTPLVIKSCLLRARKMGDGSSFLPSLSWRSELGANVAQVQFDGRDYAVVEICKSGWAPQQVVDFVDVFVALKRVELADRYEGEVVVTGSGGYIDHVMCGYESAREYPYEALFSAPHGYAVILVRLKG